MARKLFGMIEGMPDKKPEQSAAGAPETSERASSSMPTTSRLSAGLMNLHSNTIRDLNPASIASSGMRDRLGISEEGIADLAASIKEHGQHVPIMVRPLPGQMDRFQIVYGRRRLAAIRLIGNGLPVRAIVRNLKDEEALIAQGQENNLRLDPSHIERALFALEMREAGYPTEIIQQALGIDKFSVSRFTRLAQDIPGDLIEAIGPAHDIGRRFWSDFRELLVGAGEAIQPDILELLAGKKAQASTSSERFHMALGYLKERAGVAEEVDGSDRDGIEPGGPSPKLNRGSTATTGRLSRGSTRTRFGRKGYARVEMKADDKAVSLTVKVKDSPEFSEWLQRNAEGVVADLEKRWIEEGKGSW